MSQELPPSSRKALFPENRFVIVGTVLGGILGCYLFTYGPFRSKAWFYFQNSVLPDGSSIRVRDVLEGMTSYTILHLIVPAVGGVSVFSIFGYFIGAFCAWQFRNGKQRREMVACDDLDKTNPRER